MDATGVGSIHQIDAADLPMMIIAIVNTKRVPPEEK